MEQEYLENWSLVQTSIGGGETKRYHALGQCIVNSYRKQVSSLGNNCGHFKTQFKDIVSE